MLPESFRTHWATATHGCSRRWPPLLPQSILPGILSHMDPPMIKGWQMATFPPCSHLAKGKLSLSVPLSLPLSSSTAFLPSILLLGYLFHWVRAPFLQLYFTLTVSNKEPISKFRHDGDLGLPHAHSPTNTHAAAGCWPEGMETSGGVPGAKKHTKEPHHVIFQGTAVTDGSTERTQGLSPGPQGSGALHPKSVFTCPSSSSRATGG